MGTERGRRIVRVAVKWSDGGGGKRGERHSVGGGGQRFIATDADGDDVKPHDSWWRRHQQQCVLLEREGVESAVVHAGGATVVFKDRNGLREEMEAPWAI